VNNFRDHGYSDASSHGIDQWTDAYPFDVLGAWDYAVSDPEGLLGGSLPPSSVGVMAFSKGALVSAAAFGLEGRLRAAWLDAPAFRPEAVFSYKGRMVLSDMGLGFLADSIVPPVWENIEEEALSRGVDLNRFLPENTLPLGPETRRPIHVTANRDDATVPNVGPESQIDKMLGVLASHPGKYNTTSHLWEGSCQGEAHGADHLREPSAYRLGLCVFWRSAFSLDEGACSS